MVEPNEIHQVEFLMDATMLRTWTSTMSCRWWDLFTTKPILLNLINADLYDLYILFRNAVQCAQLHSQFIFDQIPQVGYTEDAWIVRNSWGTGWDSRFLFLSIGWDSKPPFWGVQGEIPNHYHHHYHDVRWGEDGYITIWFLGGAGWDSWSLSWCQMGRRGIHPPGAGRRLWDGHKTPRWHRMCQRTWQWCRILLLMMVILMIGLVAIMMIMMMVMMMMKMFLIQYWESALTPGSTCVRPVRRALWHLIPAGGKSGLDDTIYTIWYSIYDIYDMQCCLPLTFNINSFVVPYMVKICSAYHMIDKFDCNIFVLNIWS